MDKLIQCTICNDIVKNVIIWERHVKSECHITGLKLVRENLKKQKMNPKPIAQPVNKIEEINNQPEAEEDEMNKNEQNNITESNTTLQDQDLKSVKNTDPTLIKNKIMKLIVEEKESNPLPKVY